MIDIQLNSITWRAVLAVDNPAEGLRSPEIARAAPVRSGMFA
jgi:hypothetical protein